MYKRRTYIVHLLVNEEDSSKELIKQMATEFHEEHDIGIAVCLTEAIRDGFKQKSDIVDLRMSKPE